ncbi:hypothetical protein I2750_12345 [Bacillus sp. PR5]|nr:hypothetical protein [Bacillus sp. PR5]
MADNSKTASEPRPPFSDWEAQAALQSRLEADLFAINKATLFDALVFTGVTTIIVTFDGYGDSGQIEDVEVKAGDDNIAMPGAMIAFAKTVWGQSGPERSTVTIATAVENLAYDVLERTHGGWENNDGAYGEVIFDVAKREITLDYNERYTASENYMHSF